MYGFYDLQVEIDLKTTWKKIFFYPEKVHKTHVHKGNKKEKENQTDKEREIKREKDRERDREESA